MKTDAVGRFSGLARAFLAVATGMLLTAQAFAIEVTAIVEYPGTESPGVDRSVGDELYLVVLFDQNIVSYTAGAKPAELRLQTHNGDRRAICLGPAPTSVAPNGLMFSYVVKPGDFAEDLDCSTLFAFVRNDDAITFSVDGPLLAGQLTVPLGAQLGSLRTEADISIRTFQFSVPPDNTVAAGSSMTWNVTRGGTDTDAASLPAFNITVTPSSPVPNASTPVLTYSPNPFSIPAGQASAILTLTGVSAGGPYDFVLHPNSYIAGGVPITASDLAVNGVTVTPGPAPSFDMDPPLVTMDEGAFQTVALRVTQTSPVNTVISLTNTDPIRVVVPATVTLPANASSVSFQIEALDGPASATVTGSDGSGTYVAGTPLQVTVNNVAPVVTPPFASPMTTVVGGSITFVLDPGMVSDVPADEAAGFTASWDFGEGPALLNVPVDGTPIVRQYDSIGEKIVTVRVRDKDGGIGEAQLVVNVQSGISVLATIYGRYGSRSYNGLREGLGDGIVWAENAAPGGDTGMRADLTRSFTYAAPLAVPGGPTPPPVSTELNADPVPVVINGDTYDSFFHTWQGEGFVEPLATTPLANTREVLLVDQPRSVRAIFSREFYPEDNYGDIDQDELPDEWEELHWPGTRAFETPNRMGNPDGDFLPRGANANLDYPITPVGGRNYSADGTAFGNVYELRGLHPGLNAPGSDPDFGPLGVPDEPGAPLMTAGWPGTDPNNHDTDGDQFPDGWEYYFWLNALRAQANGDLTIGEAYDPTMIISGTGIPVDTVLEDFNPLIPGALTLDTDGDGLSNFEELLIGTDPIHWDTDGDRMCDGWEVLRGLDPLVRDGGGNPDGDFMAALGWNPTMPRLPAANPDPLTNWDSMHFRVYEIVGYDPRTGWGAQYIERDRSTGFPQPNTTRMLNVDEYAIMRFWIEMGHPVLGAIAEIPSTPQAWARFSTNPLSCDTDNDGAPDGWEAYVSFDPCLGQNTEGWDVDMDGLLLAQEFSGQETSAASGIRADGTPIPNVNARWWNKFWPTDPNNADTDGDGLPDGMEGGIVPGMVGDTPLSAFFYDPVARGYSTAYIRGSRAGGGLNPNSVDTDMDFIPDFWEWQYQLGRVVVLDLATGEETPVGGMDGTIFDSKSGVTQLTGQYENYDYDGDGLENYQEYWANAVYHFNYDKWAPGLGAGGYNPASLFMGIPHHWDWATAANYWQIQEGMPPPFHVQFRFILPEPRPIAIRYASTDPSLWDTDGDGMDDFYEMFHGLNPLWSETEDVIGKMPPPRIPDIRVQPWTAGEALADPDQDGLPNWEEAIFPGRPDPANYHTRPTPLWVTDTSYPESWVNLYYRPVGMPWYWPTNNMALSPVFPYPAVDLYSGMPPTYVYSFATDEGYDTDNDNIPDKKELRQGSNPADFDDPRRRKALYLDGTSAMRTQFGGRHGLNQLRSWTVELWVRAAEPVSPMGSRQIIVERPVQLWASDPMPNPDYVRRTFRIGIEPDGRPFAEYNNSGNDLLTLAPQSPAWTIQPNEWYHLSAVYDGGEKTLTLYVNGQISARTVTALIPATGIIDGNPPLVIPAPLVVGAGDNNPNGVVYAFMPPPDLHSHFKGWVDELRVWDGARPQGNIQTARMQRFTVDDVVQTMTNYAAVASAAAFENPPGTTYSAAVDLPPVLLYHFTFDTLPDPTYEPIVPEGFDLLNGRPNDGSYPGIPWWWQANDRSRVYSDYLFVQWAENTVDHIPADPVFDAFGNIIDYVFGIAHASPYWTENSRDSNFTFQNRTRTSRQTYFTSDTAMNQTFWQAKDLLPLWQARADMDVPLWDTGMPGTDPDHDSNGDGIPDWWYILYGYDPFGPSIAHLDPDGDGLTNLGEYLAGTNPFSPDTSGDGILDYDSRSSNPADDQRTFGQRFSDGDYVEDDWEARWDDAYSSPFRYDEHLDPDGDGWANWAERRVNTRPDRVFGDLYDLFGFVEYPEPILEVELDYNGVLDLSTENPDLVVHAYTDPLMKGRPDAIYRVPLNQSVANDPSGSSVFARLGRYDGSGGMQGRFVPGSIAPNSVILAFVDLDSRTLTPIVADDGQGRLRHVFGGDPIVVGSVEYGTGNFSINFRAIPADRLQPRADHLLFAGYQYEIRISSAPIKLSLRHAVPEQGWIREGKNFFHAFLDLNGDGIWQPGEPAAVADNMAGGIEVGWDKVNLRFGLSDNARSYARFAWTDRVPEGDVGDRTITIINAVSGTTVFSKVFPVTRTWLHEGDLMVGKTSAFGLDWGATGSTMAYQWRIDGVLGGTFTNRYASTLAAPVPDYPKGAWIKGARPQFRWRMEPEATEFDIEIRRHSASGTVVYSGRHQAPARRRAPGVTDVTYCVWDFPYHAGDILPNGQVFDNDSYVWRLKAYSPRATSGSAWSEASFRLDVQSVPAEAGGKEWLDVDVQYPSGFALDPGGVNRIRVQAFRTRSFNGVPEAQKTISAPGTVRLAGLTPGIYYIRAFVDQENTRTRAIWESYGYYRALDYPEEPFRVSGAATKGVDTSTRYVVIIRDCDTDQDQIPDALEYRMHGASGGDWLSIAGPGPVTSSPSYSDYDGDGINDLAELIFGSDPMQADTDGDGIDDLMERRLGLNPNVPEQLSISMASYRDGDLSVQWEWMRLSEQGFLRLGTGDAPMEFGEPVIYIVQRSDSLKNPDWVDVVSKTNKLSAGELRMQPDSVSTQGFYRVLMMMAD